MKILSIFAHREDHIVAGWPLMQKPEHEKYLFRLTGDYEGAVQESCDAAGIKCCGNAGLPNGFAVNPKRFMLSEYADTIIECVNTIISRVQPDALFTHNPWGEYGHYDHRFLFSLVYNRLSAYPLFITNIRSVSSYYNFNTFIPREYRAMFKGVSAGVPDKDFYQKHAGIFMKYNAWTENENLNLPLYPTQCNVVLLGKEDF